MNIRECFITSFLFPVFLFSSLNLKSADGGASLTWLIPAVQSIGAVIAAAMGAQVNSRNSNPYGGSSGMPDGMADMGSVRVAMHQKASMPYMENRGVPVGLQSSGYHKDTRGRGASISQNKVGSEGVKIYFTAEDEEVFLQERQREHAAESEARSKAACDKADKQWNQLKAENKKRGIKRSKNAKPYYMDNNWTVEKYRAHLDAGGDPEAYLGMTPAQEMEMRQKAIAEYDRQQKECFAKMKQKVIHTAAETIVIVGKMEDADATKTTTVETIPFLFTTHRTRDMIEQRLDTLLQENNQQPKIDLTPNNNDQIPSDGGDKDPKKGPTLKDAAGVYGVKKIKDHLTEPHPEIHTSPTTSTSTTHTASANTTNATPLSPDLAKTKHEKARDNYKAHEEKVATELQLRVNEYREKKPFRETPQAADPALHQPPHITGKELDFNIKEAKHTHMWTDKPAHVIEDTPEARRVFNECVLNPDNYIGQNLAGNFVYKGSNPKDGREIYVYVREGKPVI